MSNVKVYVILVDFLAQILLEVKYGELFPILHSYVHKNITEQLHTGN